MIWHPISRRRPAPKSRILYYDGNLAFVANVDKQGKIYADQFYCNRSDCKGRVANDCECAILSAPHHQWAPLYPPGAPEL